MWVMLSEFWGQPGKKEGGKESGRKKGKGGGVREGGRREEQKEGAGEGRGEGRRLSAKSKSAVSGEGNEWGLGVSVGGQPGGTLALDGMELGRTSSTRAVTASEGVCGAKGGQEREVPFLPSRPLLYFSGWRVELGWGTSSGAGGGC